MVCQWRGFWGLCVGLVLCWAGVLGGLLPWGADNLAQIRGETASCQKELADLQELQARHPNLEAYQLELARSCQEAVGLLPERMETLSFLSQLQESSKENNVGLLEVRPGDVHQAGQVCEQIIEVTAVGDFFAVYRWLGRLQGKRYCNIQGFAVSREGAGLVCHASLSIYADGGE